jgi:hypothetical protein
MIKVMSELERAYMPSIMQSFRVMQGHSSVICTTRTEVGTMKLPNYWVPML